MSLPNIRRNEQRHDHNSPNRALSSNHHQLECRPRQFVGNFIRPSLCNTNSQIPQKVSVAIDFGTSNCAVAYSAHSKKEDVFVINEWNDGEKHGKIPTAVLFNDKKEFVGFDICFFCFALISSVIYLEHRTLFVLFERWSTRKSFCRKIIFHRNFFSRIGSITV